jgi:SAM-dependent methyltransferase
VSAGYRDDLAHVHDAGFGGLSRAAAWHLLGELRRRRIAAGTVVDLGCGSGLLCAELGAAGFDTVGFDLSESMVGLARRRVPDGRFEVASVRTVKLPACVAAAAVGEVFNYLFDGGGGLAGLERLFRRVHRALEPGGIFLLDLAGPGNVRGRGPRRAHAEGEGWAVLATVEEDRARRRLTRHITTFRRSGRGWRRDHEVHRLALFPRAEVAARLRAAGFRVRPLPGYGPTRFPPGLAGFLARKP